MSEEKKNGTPQNFGPMVEFASGFTKVDGFWQEYTPGQTIKGILVGERRAEKGSALKQGYYIIELTAPFEGAVTRADPTKQGGKDNKKVFTAQPGQNIGIKASFDMKGIMRQVGHYFEITFLEQVPTKGGNTINKFAKKFSKNVVKEIEKVEESEADKANDVPNTGDDEIPF